MKLILENWRQFIKEQEVPASAGEGTTPTTPTDAEPEEKKQPINTIGDLRTYISRKRKMEAAGIIGKRAAVVLASMIPGAGPFMATMFTAKSFRAALKAFTGAPDETKTNTALDKLNIPDEASKIVDDNLEEEFINVFMQSLEDLPDNAPIPDAAEHLEKWLSGKFSGTTVKK